VLRPYQTKALEADEKARAGGARVVCMAAPTGAGKTVIGAEWGRRRGGQGIWVVHRQELESQAKAHLAKSGANARVLTIQSRLTQGDLPDGDWYVVDEFHHFLSGAPKWSATAARVRQGPTLLLSATPQRSDGAPIGDLADAIIVVAQPKELIADGHLVRARIVSPAKPDKSLSMDPVEAYKRHAFGQQAIAFCTSVDYAEELAEKFDAAGISSNVIHGKLSDDSRRIRLERHQRKEYAVLSSVYVLTEGYDDPGVSCAIMCRLFGSVSGWIQAAGRVVRPAPCKTNATILDLCGNVMKWGMLEADRTYALENGVHIVGAAEDSGPAIRQCPQCQHIFASDEWNPGCPGCGYIPERDAAPKIVERPLESYSLEDQQSMARYFEHLQSVAASLGRKPGWCAYEYKRLYGHWPNWERKDGWSPHSDVTARRGSESPSQYYARLMAFASQRGFKPGWAKLKFRDQWGYWPRGQPS
jgi:superfamily II DNA or RNA helicase